MLSTGYQCKLSMGNSKKLSRVYHLFLFTSKVICIVVVDINNSV